ncbi:beta-ketoacyl-[acyl-carrier-protein] synthase family protein [Dyadobacter flavalbus]|uniref:3-oxoacyl-[acyl-carrier-protein] synthase 1 n=1 Tax=Dyadobacter flavalbus TaxID=2579942 RepID=A0A5M8QQJ1_9BACT|nr:beta-ketoacyl-[acyl-carrier-protein] synthase family protein [Dyadobacter flavalbus]KAA6438455.1 beta-ketoacyl-[acyl-carrier-protein] synthase family protein [Dyadobacter flavalbus]
MDNRVVITGLGVVAPNGVGLEAFESALRAGRSGIRFDRELEELKFSCQISGKPQLGEPDIAPYFSTLELRNFNSKGIMYGVMAGMDSWKDAGLPLSEKDEPSWDYGMVFGSGTSGIDRFREAIYDIDALNVRRLGSTVVLQTMNSGVSAYLSGKLGLGNQVITNSSACSTGTESLLMAYERIRSGKASVVLSGATSDSGPYIWGGFDAMKVCTYKYNQEPEHGSRPMSSNASGFVPGSGAGALVVESLDHALARGARIYAEVLGGHVNSGGQRGKGSMTAPNPVAVQRCIREALHHAGVSADEVDLINGHLTATAMDALEIRNWVEALDRCGTDFPLINTLKGMTGHCLTAAGSIECVASVLQLYSNFVFPNVNCEEPHPEILNLIDSEKIPRETLNRQSRILIKASFGFGDINACVVLKKYAEPDA